MRFIILIIFAIFQLNDLRHAECEGYLAPSANKPRLYLTLEPKTFVYDNKNLHNWVGYIKANHTVAICESHGRHHRLCSTGNMPDYYVKSDIDIKPLDSTALPRITKIIAQDNVVDLVFTEASYPPAILTDYSAGQVEMALFPAELSLEYIRYEKTWTGEQIRLQNNGNSSLTLSINKDVKCGFDFYEYQRGILRISFNDCSKENFIITLDPGHGGSERGTCYKEHCEAELALNLAIKLKKLLEKQGYKVSLTRNSDTTVELKDRVDMAEKIKTSLLVSLHFDRWDPSLYFKKAPSGSSCYYFYEFMSQYAKRMCSNDGPLPVLGSNSITQRGFYMLHSFQFASILIEVGNFANAKDTAIMLKSNFLDDAAQSLNARISEIAEFMQGSSNAAALN